MGENKYFLSYDFNIIFCEDFTFRQNCKKLNSDLEFIPYKGNTSILDYYIEINPYIVNQIVNHILNNPIGKELNKEDMLWIQSFEELMKSEENKLLNDDKLMYNYLILKLQLIGFSEELAITYIENYYINKDILSKEVQIKDLLININNNISNKKFWIGNDIYKYENEEIEFITSMLRMKDKYKHKFDFEKRCKTQYLSIINNSFLNYIINFNKTKSYLIKEILPEREFDEYVSKSYYLIIKELFDIVIDNNFKTNSFIQNSQQFIEKTINEMYDLVKLYYKALNKNNTIYFKK